MATCQVSKLFFAKHLINSGTVCCHRNVAGKLLNQSSASVFQRKHVSTVVSPRPAYGGRHRVTMLPGDGVGPELMQSVKHVFRFAGVPVDFEEIDLNSTMTGEEDFENALLAIKRNHIAIKGNISTDIDDPKQRSLNRALRSELDLFANVVRCRSIQGIRARHQDVDIVIIRENTEGEYSALEHTVQDENVGGVVESLKIITERKSTRIAKYAFEYAKRHKRHKITAVHKANIMKLADGLFLECCREVAKDYPDIEFEGMIVDNCSMQMVSKPQQFDVMVLPNLYGNIIANIGAGLVGGPGVVPGVNLGKDNAVYEMATRNTGKSIMGRNKANPSAMLLASADMLYHIGLKSYGKMIRDAVYDVISEGEVHTQDLGGHATTEEVLNAITNHIKENSSVRLPSYS